MLRQSQKSFSKNVVSTCAIKGIFWQSGLHFFFLHFLKVHAFENVRVQGFVRICKIGKVTDV